MNETSYGISIGNSTIDDEGIIIDGGIIIGDCEIANGFTVSSLYVPPDPPSFGNGMPVEHTYAYGLLKTTSSKKHMKDIKNLEDRSDDVMKMRPVRFTWTAGNSCGKSDIGLLAEEVHELFPEVVSLDEGEPDSIRYRQLYLI